MRSFNLLITSVAILLAIQPASAQQATLAVSARILPSADAMAAGTIAPSLESGHTIAASARLSDLATLPVIVAKSASLTAQGFADFKLGMAVSANVQYSVAVSSNVEQLKIQKRSAMGRQEISYRVPKVVGSQPAPIVVTLTAASIT